MGIDKWRMVWRWSRRWVSAAAVVAMAVGAGGTQATGGALDPSFGRGGTVLTDLGAAVGRAVAVQADGKIVVAGSAHAKARADFALVRYTTTGKLDASFGRGGKVLTDLGARSVDQAGAVAVQADGKIVAAGKSGEEVWGQFALVRYTTGGNLDANFGRGGKVLSGGAIADIGTASALAVQKDGKILAAVPSYNPSVNPFELVRYTAGGKPDKSFGRGGTVLTDLGETAWASAVALQQDGKIVAAGSAGENIGAGENFALARYTASGKLDASFGSGGKVLTDLGGKDVPSAVAVQGDGKIVVAGSIDTGGISVALVRYTTDGKLDTGFGTGGKVLTIGECVDGAPAVALQKDGKIVVAWDDCYHYHFALARLTTGGKLDASFGRGGKVLTDLGDKEGASALAVQADGKIVAAGYSTAGTSPRSENIALVRYTTDGKLDASFGTGGKVLTNFAGYTN